MERRKKAYWITGIVGALFIIVYFVFLNKYSVKEKPDDDSGNNNQILSEEIYMKDLFTADAELKTKWDSDNLYYKLILTGRYVDLLKMPEDSIIRYQNLAIHLTDKDNFALQKMNIVESHLIMDKVNNFFFYDGDIKMDGNTFQKIDSFIVVYDKAIE